jgi:glycine cleavage system H protein
VTTTVEIEGVVYPTNRYYDVENQIWYAPLPDGLVRAGLTPLAFSYAGEILVFTPKRIGREFEAGRSFATLEGGKWAGAARAAFDGVVVAVNEDVIERPALLGEDAFGRGWMLAVRPARSDWQASLVTGDAIAGAFAEWLSKPRREAGD